MPKVHILNSAVMPQEGFYSLYQLTEQEWTAEIKEAIETLEYEHYIGYKSTLDLVNHLIKKDIGELSREKTKLASGDFLFIVKLKYRVDPKSKKIDAPKPSDFEFFKGKYYKTAGELYRTST